MASSRVPRAQGKDGFDRRVQGLDDAEAERMVTVGGNASQVIRERVAEFSMSGRCCRNAFNQPNAAYRFHLGSAYLRQGDIKQARDQFTRVLQLNPNFSQAEQVRTALASMRKTGAD